MFLNGDNKIFIFFSTIFCYKFKILTEFLIIDFFFCRLFCLKYSYPFRRRQGNLCCCLSIGRSVSLSIGRSALQHIRFIFFAYVAHTERKLCILNYHQNIYDKICVGYDLAMFDRVMLLGIAKIPSIRFPFIIFARV